MAMQHSRSRRRVKVKAPSGRIAIQYRKRMKNSVSCEKCGSKLAGVSSQRQLPKSKKVPSRPYGGSLCTKCTRSLMRSRVLSNA